MTTARATGRDVRARKAVIVGQGYVGSAPAARCVRAGHDTVGVAIDAERVKRLQASDSYVVPAGTPSRHHESSPCW